MNPQIAPSILSADFTRLGEEIQSVLDSGADLIHVDVMDNHYVPNLTIGPLVFKSLRAEFPTVCFDVHLMCNPVDRLLEEYVDLGVNMVSFHPETCDDPLKTLGRIRKQHVKAGIALNPAVSMDVLGDLWDDLDHVLVMSVKPGFGGQSFMPEVLNKVEEIKRKIHSENRVVSVQIDGGINESTIKQAAQAGADIFVAGSAIFSAKNYREQISQLRALAT